MDDESISRICVSAFTESDIVTAKNLLFDSIPTTKRKITRKKVGKALRDIDDIICVIRDTDSEDIPVFVARDLEKLPPVLFDHVDVTRLLKDIVKLKHDLDIIKEDYATVKQLELLKDEVQSLQHSSVINYGPNVNKRRGACLLDSYECASGPMGLTPVCDETIVECDMQHNVNSYRSMTHNLVSSEGSKTSPQPAQKDTADARRETDGMSHNIDQLIGSAHAPQPALASSSPPLPSLPTAVRRPQQPTGSNVRHTVAQIGRDQQKCMAEIVREGTWKPQTQSDEWIRVQRKSLRNRFTGKRGKAILETTSNFKAAEIKIPVYIYNVAKSASVCDITDYIMKKTNIEVKIEKMVYMPTESNDNLVEFTECLGEMTAIIDSHCVESVFMLGDFNAYPGAFSNQS
ncbi:uncharacterized protein LOC126381425 [Pectinophora gossypiella]|uniref:uncharacterized protein LOC126381425 n=1 Tax=Pectinophora gossypiella TaxID=13191 RepID=UPI00214F1BBD|nr:uncharacterized protein LOC126381425 [Pectinophora gossypiella]